MARARPLRMRSILQSSVPAATDGRQAHWAQTRSFRSASALSADRSRYWRSSRARSQAWPCISAKWFSPRARLLRQTGSPDGAAGAAAIFDDDLLAERTRELVGDD